MRQKSAISWVVGKFLDTIKHSKSIFRVGSLTLTPYFSRPLQFLRFLGHLFKFLFNQKYKIFDFFSSLLKPSLFGAEITCNKKVPFPEPLVSFWIRLSIQKVSSEFGVYNPHHTFQGPLSFWDCLGIFSNFCSTKNTTFLNFFGACL